MLSGEQADVQWKRRLKFGPSKTCLKRHSIFVYEIIFPIEIDHQSKESNGDGVMRVGGVSANGTELQNGRTGSNIAVAPFGQKNQGRLRTQQPV